VTDRDRVVAEISAPRADRSRAVGDAVLAELVRQGLCTPARHPRGHVPPAKPAVPTEQLVRDLREDRDSR
jgi:hypothetical protein